MNRRERRRRGNVRRAARSSIGGRGARRHEEKRPRGLQLAIAAHDEGRVHEALRLYHLFLAVRPDDVDALNLAGIAAIQAGAYDAAIELLGAAVRHNPGAADTNYNLGVALARLRRFDEAESACRRALALSPHHAGAKAAVRSTAARKQRQLTQPSLQPLESS